MSTDYQFLHFLKTKFKNKFVQENPIKDVVWLNVDGYHIC